MAPKPEGLVDDWEPGRRTSGKEARRLSAYTATRAVPLSKTTAYLLLCCYFLFVIYRLARLIFAWRQTSRTFYASRVRAIPDGTASLVARCKKACGVEDPLILFSPVLAGPVTVGVRESAIILPEGFIERTSSEELTAVLCHEMAHIARHDFLLNLIYELVYLPVSFHPAARLIKRRIDETRELTCDEMAAGSLVSASAYARSLVSLARAMSTPARLSQPGYSLGVFDADILEERVMRLLNKISRLSARVAAMSLLAASLLLATTSLAASAFAFSVGQEKKTQAENGEKLFLGTWQGKFYGEPFVNLVLRLEDGKVTGTLSRFSIKMDGSGNLVETEGGEEVEWHVVEAKLGDSTLTLRCQNEQSGDVNQFELRLTRDSDNTEFRPLDAPFPVKPWKMTRTSQTGPVAVRPGGPVEGVVGGVINGFPGGSKGGVIGGVPGDVQRRGEQVLGSISGAVSDPSGARVPGAFVSASNQKAGFSKRIVTDEAGEFSLKSAPPGNYELEVKKPGFKVMHLDVVLGPPLGNGGEFNLRMEPETVLEAVEVTAKAPPGHRETPAKGRPQRIRVGGLVEATKLIRQTKPEYPENARAKGIQGIVMLEAVISKEGEPLSLHVVQSADPALSDAAMAAVKQWRYEPTLLNGEPIEVVTEIAVRFRLEK